MLSFKIKTILNNELNKKFEWSYFYERKISRGQIFADLQINLEIPENWNWFQYGNKRNLSGHRA